MNTDILNKVEKSMIRTDLPTFNVGDSITVHNVIREGDKSRVQLFKGIVIARRGAGLSATFTVRKISDGIGVEKIFPVHSPNVEKITVDKYGKTRRAKIYYMRDRVGKSAMKINAVSDVAADKLKKAEEKRVADMEKAAAKAEKAAEAKETPAEEAKSE